MKRTRFTAIAVACSVFCIVAFSYASSVLTPVQMSEIWGGGDCEKCIPPGAWTGASPGCNGNDCRHRRCPHTYQSRSNGYCYGPNREYNCNGGHLAFYGRRVDCRCTNNWKCETPYDYDYADERPNCSHVLRDVTCD